MIRREDAKVDYGEREYFLAPLLIWLRGCEYNEGENTNLEAQALLELCRKVVRAKRSAERRDTQGT